MKKNLEIARPIHVTDNAIAQGPAGHHADPTEEWRDGNGY
jgi:hypothetical protein